MGRDKGTKDRNREVNNIEKCKKQYLKRKKYTLFYNVK
jgi:hypothetical protein